ncbi:MAG TPA: hypothetical protein VM425_12145 [Myxococcota bacterium]|nr:hypothetical protein [Myxococcota bacterium]
MPLKKKVSRTYSLVAAEVAHRESQKQPPHVKTPGTTQVRRILEDCYIIGDAARLDDLDRLYKKSRRLRGRRIDSTGKVVPFGGKTVLRSALRRCMRDAHFDKVGQFLWRIGLDAPEHIEGVFDRPLEPLRYYWRCDPDFLDYVLGPGTPELRNKYGHEKGTLLALAVMKKHVGRCGRPKKGDVSPIELLTHLYLNEMFPEQRIGSKDSTPARIRMRIEKLPAREVAAAYSRLCDCYRKSRT